MNMNTTITVADMTRDTVMATGNIMIGITITAIMYSTKVAPK